MKRSKAFLKALIPVLVISGIIISVLALNCVALLVLGKYAAVLILAECVIFISALIYSDYRKYRKEK